MSSLRVSVFLLLFYSCISSVNGQAGEDKEASPGVPYALAVYRSTVLGNIFYSLEFTVPAQKTLSVQGHEHLIFGLDARGAAQPLLLDFKAPSSALHELWVNGLRTAVEIRDEHLAIPPAFLHAGNDTVDIAFTCGDGALNRNSEYLYTLLVPDRARTLFPCFDQPDLKAVFTLGLTIPAGWKALGNAPLLDSTVLGDSCRFRFQPSDRISTYLFSFVTGRWTATSQVADGRLMHLLYRETDSTKLRLSLDSIFRIEGQALHFMRDYTGIAYPFEKFDFVAIPDFQFGGMEHVGAIQYKASSLFLDSGATREQLIGRSNLLSHETAHMWFGDLVTMTWFNDVWMKEVFANFMADKISSITLPDGNYDLKFLTDHYPAAYSIDRTAGAHPIRQELDNLQEAGSLYGNIIYHKAPIVMRQLERVIGPDGFRDGLRDYLAKYAGRNASWPDLIAALQGHTTVDLAAWNEVWVNGTGRPLLSYELRTKGGRITGLTIRQRGEDGSARLWPQLFEIALVYPNRVEQLPVNMNAKAVHLTGANGKEQPLCVILNADGQGYGIFPIDPHATSWLTGDSVMSKTGAVMRAAAYINGYENMLAGRALTPLQLLAQNRRLLAREPEELNLNILLDQLASVYWRFLPPATRDSVAAGLENDCWEAMLRVTADNKKKLLFRTYSSIVLSRGGQDRLFSIWKERRPPAGVKLSEDDYTGVAANLALRVYPGYDSILQEQLGRITNSDRRDRWLFLQPSLSADTGERDRFFASLQDPKIRRKEAWVLAALAYLHHPLRTGASEKYLPATLGWLEDIQRTGDVFFPQSWLQTSFNYYQTASAAAIVREFLRTHPGYNPRLKNKILQATDNLQRAQTLIGAQAATRAQR